MHVTVQVLQRNSMYAHKIIWSTPSSMFACLYVQYSISWSGRKHFPFLATVQCSCATRNILQLRSKKHCDKKNLFQSPLGIFTQQWQGSKQFLSSSLLSWWPLQKIRRTSFPLPPGPRAPGSRILWATGVKVSAIETTFPFPSFWNFDFDFTISQPWRRTTGWTTKSCRPPIDPRAAASLLPGETGV